MEGDIDSLIGCVEQLVSRASLYVGPTRDITAMIINSYSLLRSETPLHLSRTGEITSTSPSSESIVRCDTPDVPQRRSARNVD